VERIVRVLEGSIVGIGRVNGAGGKALMFVRFLAVVLRVALSDGMRDAGFIGIGGSPDERTSGGVIANGSVGGDADVENGREKTVLAKTKPIRVHNLHEDLLCSNIRGDL